MKASLTASRQGSSGSRVIEHIYVCRLRCSCLCQCLKDASSSISRSKGRKASFEMDIFVSRCSPEKPRKKRNRAAGEIHGGNKNENKTVKRN